MVLWIVLDNDGIRLQSIFVFVNAGFVGNGVVVQPDGMIVTQANGSLYRYNPTASSIRPLIRTALPLFLVRDARSFGSRMEHY